MIWGAIMDFCSDFLYARPSFLEGMARIMDLGNTLNEYNTSDAPDKIATFRDWTIVGNDLRSAFGDERKTSTTVSKT